MVTTEGPILVWFIFLFSFEIKFVIFIAMLIVAWPEPMVTQFFWCIHVSLIQVQLLVHRMNWKAAWLQSVGCVSQLQSTNCVYRWFTVRNTTHRASNKNDWLKHWKSIDWLWFFTTISISHWPPRLILIDLYTLLYTHSVLMRTCAWYTYHWGHIVDRDFFLLSLSLCLIYSSLITCILYAISYRRQHVFTVYIIIESALHCGFCRRNNVNHGQRHRSWCWAHNKYKIYLTMR